MNSLKNESYFRDDGFYISPIKRNSKIFCKIGRIKKRSDGRYTWFIWKHPYDLSWNDNKDSQGVTNTIDESKNIILKAWR